ncbi:hypothetical protein [Lentzea sp. NPDC092896]|uniref:hypothetical protein n=1 Tax=Lentzea sp. NPDC092896 TaxID=3364127 RepID=UPI0038021B10
MLTTAHLLRTDTGHIQLQLGALDLVAPLDQLLLDLVGNRKGHAVIGHTDDHPWPFPGGSPGRHLGSARLAHRLKKLGIQPRAGRNSALMEPAAETPAKVLSDLLGISISSAVHWTEETGNARPGYAAELARRRR